MKILAYRIEQKGPRSLVDLMRSLSRNPIETRYTDPVTELRLEASQLRSGVLCMDFARPRGGHGPGRMSRRRAIEHIQLDDDESFAEDTGIAFNSDTNYAAIQYNHFGPRVGAIENYLAGYDLSLGGIRSPENDERAQDLCGFSFGAVLRPDSFAKLRSFGIMRELSFTLAVPGVRAADLTAGRSLTQVLEAPLPQGIETLSVSMCATNKKSSRLARNTVIGFVQDLQRLGESLQMAKVKGRTASGDPLEQIDLIEERVSAEVRINVADGRRYSRSDRWAALTRTLMEWTENNQLPEQQG